MEEEHDSKHIPVWEGEFERKYRGPCLLLHCREGGVAALLTKATAALSGRPAQPRIFHPKDGPSSDA
jgi:hypothetical protein